MLGGFLSLIISVLSDKPFRWCSFHPCMFYIAGSRGDLLFSVMGVAICHLPFGHLANENQACGLQNWFANASASRMRSMWHAQHSTALWCRLAGCQMYLYQLQVFVNITNCICPFCKVYLSYLQNVFVPIAECICAEHSRAQWCKQLMLVRSLADLFSRSCSFESIYSITAEQSSASIAEQCIAP